MQDIICAICGIKQQKKLLYKSTVTKESLTPITFSARRLPDRVHYQLNICENCGLIFSSPVLTPKKIENLYKDSSCSYPKQIKYLTKTYYKLFDQIKKNLPTNPRILEIGCGDGFFLKALKDKGYKNIFGVEPSKRMALKRSVDLQKRIKVSIFKKKLFPEHFFHLICCFHTLDHVADPNQFLKETNLILQKKGIALFVIHDTGALSVKLFKERSPIFDVEHIYLFNQENISKIFIKNNFKVLKVASLTNEYPLWYWIGMAGIPLNVKKALQFFVKYSGLNRMDLSFKGGNLFIVAQKK